MMLVYCTVNVWSIREVVMKELSKKTLSVIIASTMIVSMTGCSFNDKSKDEVLEAAESYAKYLADCDLKKLSKATVSDLKEDKDEWEERLDFTAGDLYGEDTAAALAAIADTISYEIDEESAEASKKTGEGSVQATFTIVDYEPLLGDESIDRIEDFIDALEDADTKELEISLDFEKEDEEWLCANYEEIFDDLYGFTKEDFEFTPPASDYFDGIIWYRDTDDNGTYHNTYCIEFSVVLTSDCPYDHSELYYTVDYNGQTIYSDYLSYSEVFVTNEDIPDYTDPTGFFLAEGEYIITITTPDGSIFTTCTATVTYDTVDLVFDEDLYWYFTDEYGMDEPVYTNTQTIDAMLQYDGASYYAAPYATLEYEGEVIYQENDSCEIWVYTTNSDMPLDPSGQYFAAGTYTITFYDADGNVIVSDSCTVNVE